MIQENNWADTTKKGKGKLPLFHVYGERVIPIHCVGCILYVNPDVMKYVKVNIWIFPFLKPFCK